MKVKKLEFIYTIAYWYASAESRYYIVWDDGSDEVYFRDTTSTNDLTFCVKKLAGARTLQAKFDYCERHNLNCIIEKSLAQINALVEVVKSCNLTLFELSGQKL